jgi:hypothetical protein
MLKTQFDELEEGDWCFLREDTYMTLCWGPDRFTQSVTIPIMKASEPSRKVPTPWSWNGDKEKPTLNPSIRVNGEMDWQKFHCFLRDGVIERLED